MIVYSQEEYPQLSDLWWEIRNGVPTASEFHRIIRASDGETSKSQEAYALELAKAIQCPTAKYFSEGGKPVNVHIQRGRNIEEEALAWYSMVHKVAIKRAGFITTDDGRFGCSPDGLIVNSEGKPVAGIEVKSPGVDKHDKYVKEGVLPMEYKAQTNGCALVCGLPYWVYLQYNPDSSTPTLCLKIYWNDFTDRLKQELEVFWKKLQKSKEDLKVMSDVDRAMEVYRERLTDLKDPVSMDRVNQWMKDIKAGVEPLSWDAKDAVWKLIQAHAKRQVPPWHFDRESCSFKLEEMVGF